MDKDKLICNSYNPYDRERHEEACKNYKYELLIRKNPNDLGESFFSNDMEKIDGLKMGLRISGFHNMESGNEFKGLFYKLIHNIY